LTSLIARNIPYLRDRILADKLFLFKVGAEVLIDSGVQDSATARMSDHCFTTAALPTTDQRSSPSADSLTTALCGLQDVQL
jgi:hypothetical protein